MKFSKYIRIELQTYCSPLNLEAVRFNILVNHFFIYLSSYPFYLSVFSQLLTHFSFLYVLLIATLEFLMEIILFHSYFLYWIAWFYYFPVLFSVSLSIISTSFQISRASLYYHGCRYRKRVKPIENIFESHQYWTCKFQYAKSKAEARDQKWKYKNFQEYLSNNSDNICKEHFAESCVSFYKMAVYCIFK